MKSLRKMLGSVEDPSVIAMMQVIETQSKETLAHWAVEYVDRFCLPIYEKAYPEETTLQDTLAEVRSFLDGSKSLGEVKEALKAARMTVKEATIDPAAQAAARAVATACAVITTPTNALGFTFYAAAAIVYAKAGLSESADVYNELAAKEMKSMAASLQEAAVENEPNPVKVKWNC